VAAKQLPRAIVRKVASPTTLTALLLFRGRRKRRFRHPINPAPTVCIGFAPIELRDVPALRWAVLAAFDRVALLQQQALTGRARHRAHRVHLAPAVGGALDDRFSDARCRDTANTIMASGASSRPHQQAGYLTASRCRATATLSSCNSGPSLQGEVFSPELRPAPRVTSQPLLHFSDRVKLRGGRADG